MNVLVVDDLRVIPRPAMYARTLDAGMDLLWLAAEGDELWLDHDLGGDATIRPLVDHVEEVAVVGEKYPFSKIVILTNNPVGAKYIRSALEDHYKVETYRGECGSVEQQ